MLQKNRYTKELDSANVLKGAYCPLYVERTLKNLAPRKVLARFFNAAPDTIKDWQRGRRQIPFNKIMQMHLQAPQTLDWYCTFIERLRNAPDKRQLDLFRSEA